MSLNQTFKDKSISPLNRVGYCGGTLIGNALGHGWDILKAFSPVMTEDRVSNVGRSLTNAVAPIAKIHREQGVRLNKIPHQVDARELANMTATEAVKAGLKHGFGNAVHARKTVKPKHGPAPGMKFQPT